MASPSCCAGWLDILRWRVKDAAVVGAPKGRFNKAILGFSGYALGRLCVAKGSGIVVQCVVKGNKKSAARWG